MSFATLTNFAVNNAQNDQGMGSGFWLLVIALTIFMIAALWRVFTKAGRPGWAAIVPIYNTYTMIKIAGRPGWWLILFFIPIVNIVIQFIVLYDLARAFGKDVGYALLLFFLPFIGFPMLAWGDAKYKKPKIKR